VTVTVTVGTIETNNTNNTTTTRTQVWHVYMQATQNANHISLLPAYKQPQGP
jgi:hypothetical protein